MRPVLAAELAGSGELGGSQASLVDIPIDVAGAQARTFGHAWMGLLGVRF